MSENRTSLPFQSIIDRARHVATSAHEGQTDKAGLPYREHPARVVGHARGLEVPEEIRDQVLAAAWLHDVIEDTAVTEADLARQFPEDVVKAVVALTRLKGEYPDEYYARVASNRIALYVKEADLADNTDPERLALLPTPTRERLERKYAHARQTLGL